MNEPATSKRCCWCGDDCPRWGVAVCPMRPRQLPREAVPNAPLYRTPDQENSMTPPKNCTDHTPPGFVGHWRDWHRGHGCDQDDGKPRSSSAQTEIAQMAEHASTGFLTDAELSFLRASTTAGNTLLVRALDELASRRQALKWLQDADPGDLHPDPDKREIARTCQLRIAGRLQRKIEVP